MPRQKKSWSELDDKQKAGALVVVAISAVLVALAQRDLSSRQAWQVRGPKLLWRIVCTNLLGALAYLVIGRRSATEQL
jgi:hypothetical protein